MHYPKKSRRKTEITPPHKEEENDIITDFISHRVYYQKKDKISDKKRGKRFCVCDINHIIHFKKLFPCLFHHAFKKTYHNSSALYINNLLGVCVIAYTTKVLTFGFGFNFCYLHIFLRGNIYFYEEIC